MSNRRKMKSKRSTPAGAASTKSRLVAGLDERGRLRRAQRASLEKFNPFTDAVDEMLTLLETLASTPGLDDEVGFLLEEAQRWVVDGIDHILSASDPHTVEEARLLLELEFLLRDFAATPANVLEWADVEAWRRQHKFGFGKLREREERRQGLDEHQVVAARDYWITHSVESHPKPRNDLTPPTSHPSYSLLNSFGDLLNHTHSVIAAADAYVEARGLALPSEFEGLSLDAYDEFFERSMKVLLPHVPEAELAATRIPRAKKAVGLSDQRCNWSVV